MALNKRAEILVAGKVAAAAAAAAAAAVLGDLKHAVVVLGPTALLLLCFATINVPGTYEFTIGNLGQANAFGMIRSWAHSLRSSIQPEFALHESACMLPAHAARNLPPVLVNFGFR
jgi:hypothetical protein